MQQLVKMKIKQALEKELDNYHELLLGALGRISCFEREISDLKTHSSMPQASPRGTVSPQIPPSSSQLCRHWLQNRCTYSTRCRFKHGSESSSASFSSLNANINEKDKVSSSFILPNIQNFLLPKSLNTKAPKVDRSMPSLSAVPTIATKAHSRVVSTQKQLPNQISSEIEDAAANINGATAAHSLKQTSNVKPAAVPFCPKAMVVPKIQEIESKFSDRCRPRCVQGITFSASVPTSAIDFSKVSHH